MPDTFRPCEKEDCARNFTYEIPKERTPSQWMVDTSLLVCWTCSHYKTVDQFQSRYPTE